MQESDGAENFRSAWRRGWIRAIFEYASSPLQSKSWLMRNESWSSSPTECVYRYFWDLCLTDSYVDALARGLVTRKEADAVGAFHRLAEKCSIDGTAENVLRDPNWIEVTAAARDAWKNLKQLITDPDESNLMRDLERTWGLGLED